MMTKVQLRRSALRRNRELTPQQVRDGSLAIVERLLSDSLWQKAKWVFLYRCLPGEVDADPLITLAARAGKKPAVPRVTPEGLRFHEVADPEAPYVRGAYGISEPKVDWPAALPGPGERVLFLVPGLAFDRLCYRLGRGGGYYDRVVRGVREDDRIDGRFLGVCFAFQVVETLPHDPWDLPMDALLTEQGRVSP